MLATWALPQSALLYPQAEKSPAGKLTASCAISSPAMAMESSLFTELATQLAPLFMRTELTWTILRSKTRDHPQYLFLSGTGNLHAGIRSAELGERPRA